MNDMDFQAALKSHTAKFKELAKKLSSDSGWDGGWIGLADEERKVIADFKSFSTISAAALGVNFKIASASPTDLFLIKSITILTFLEEMRA